MAKVNLPLDKLVVRRDFNAHVALEFYRGDKWSEYLSFDPSGLQKYREPTAKFEARYNKLLDTPIERAALTLIGSLKGAYLPGDGVAEIILEIFTMAATNNNDLTALDTKGLLEVFNKLAIAAGKTELKSFKESKAKLIARIEALQAEVAKPTAKQVAAKASSAAKAEKRLEGLADLKAKKEAAKQPKQSERTTLKPTAKQDGKVKPAQNEPKTADQKKAEGSAKGAAIQKAKSQGIGAFCMDLIKAGKNNADVLAAAQKQFPGAKTSASSVAWYRNKLKSDGEIAA